jgi:hypothetical protein
LHNELSQQPAAFLAASGQIVSYNELSQSSQPTNYPTTSSPNNQHAVDQ